MGNTGFLYRQYFLYFANCNRLFLCDSLHLNDEMLLDFGELDNFGLLNLLCFNDKILFNFAFGDNLFLLDASDFDVTVHLDFAFLDDLFLSNTCPLDLLLHLVFTFLHALFHLKLEFKGLGLPFRGIDSNIFLLVGFCPCLLLFGFEFLYPSVDLNLNDGDLFFLDNPFFFSFLLGCDFGDFSDTDCVESVFGIKRFNGGLIYPNNRYGFKG